MEENKEKEKAKWEETRITKKDKERRMKSEGDKEEKGTDEKRKGITVEGGMTHN